MLLVLCNEEWGDVYDAVVEHHPVLGPLYFFALILVGQFLLLNLVLAGVVEGAVEMFNQALDNQEVTLKL